MEDFERKGDGFGVGVGRGGGQHVGEGDPAEGDFSGEDGFEFVDAVLHYKGDFLFYSLAYPLFYFGVYALESAAKVPETFAEDDGPEEGDGGEDESGDSDGSVYGVDVAGEAFGEGVVGFFEEADLFF